MDDAFIEQFGGIIGKTEKKKPKPKAMPPNRKKKAVSQKVLRTEKNAATLDKTIGYYYSQIDAGVFAKPPWTMPKLSTVLDSYSHEKKQALLRRIKTSISVVNVSAVTKSVFMTGINVIEQVCNYWDSTQESVYKKLLVKGVSTRCELAYPQIRPCIEQIYIDNLGAIGIANSPWAMLTLVLVSVFKDARDRNMAKYLSSEPTDADTRQRAKEAAKML